MTFLSFYYIKKKKIKTKKTKSIKKELKTNCPFPSQLPIV